MTTFRGVSPVVHLPLDETGDVVLDQVAATVDRMLAFDCAGVVTLGLATETWTLTDAERHDVCRATVDAARGAPVFAGVDGDTPAAVREGATLIELGVSGLMVRPPQDAGPGDVCRHYVDVAGAVDAPILVQDAPQSTGVHMPVEVLLHMADTSPHLRSVKVEEVGAGPKISALAANGVDVVAGWGGLHYLESLRRGAVGCMPGSDLGPAFVEIDRLHRHGLVGEADDLYRAVLPLLSYEAQSLGLLVVGAKLALHRAGVLRSAAVRMTGADLDAVALATFEELFERLSADGVPGF